MPMSKFLRFRILAAFADGGGSASAGRDLSRRRLAHACPTTRPPRCSGSSLTPTAAPANHGRGRGDRHRAPQSRAVAQQVPAQIYMTLPLQPAIGPGDRRVVDTGSAAAGPSWSAGERTLVYSGPIKSQPARGNDEREGPGRRLSPRDASAPRIPLRDRRQLSAHGPRPSRAIARTSRSRSSLPPMPIAQGFAAVITPPRFELSVKAGDRVATRSSRSPTRCRTPTVIRARTTDWKFDARDVVQFDDALDARQLPARGSRSSAARSPIAGGGNYRFRFEIAPPADAPPGECRFALMLIEGDEQTVADGGQRDVRRSPRALASSCTRRSPTRSRSSKSWHARRASSTTNRRAGRRRAATLATRTAGSSGFLSGSDAAGQKSRVQHLDAADPARRNARPRADRARRAATSRCKIVVPVTIRGKLEWGWRDRAVRATLRPMSWRWSVCALALAGAALPITARSAGPRDGAASREACTGSAGRACSPGHRAGQRRTHSRSARSAGLRGPAHQRRRTGTDPLRGTGSDLQRAKACRASSASKRSASRITGTGGNVVAERCAVPGYDRHPRLRRVSRSTPRCRSGAGIVDRSRSTQRGMPFDGGWRANNVLRRRATRRASTSRAQQYRFFLPTFPTRRRLSPEWLRNDDVQLQASVGQRRQLRRLLSRGSRR